MGRCRCPTARRASPGRGTGPPPHLPAARFEVLASDCPLTVKAPLVHRQVVGDLVSGRGIEPAANGGGEAVAACVAEVRLRATQLPPVGWRLYPSATNVRRQQRLAYPQKALEGALAVGVAAFAVVVVANGAVGGTESTRPASSCYRRRARRRSHCRPQWDSSGRALESRGAP